MSNGQGRNNILFVAQSGRVLGLGYVAEAICSMGKIKQTKHECSFCDKLLIKGNLEKHERVCKKNPKNEKICPECFTTHTKEGITCSYSCSNKHFRHKRKGGARYKPTKELIASGKYREICFRFHEKSCIVCGEDKIVAVHHIDEDHTNNDPENLVVLCPTHHCYIHSEYADEIRPYIEDYFCKWDRKEKDN